VIAAALAGRPVLLEDAQRRVFWVEGLREGEPLRGEKTHAASFRIR